MVLYLCCFILQPSERSPTVVQDGLATDTNVLITSKKVNGKIKLSPTVQTWYIKLCTIYKKKALLSLFGIKTPERHILVKVI